jgi:SAM-dependent methyltransferase
MFSDVDRSANPAAAVAYLDAAAERMSALKAELVRLLDPAPGSRVLDVGCGAGHDLVSLARRGAMAVGIDRSIRMANESRKRCTAEGVSAVALTGDAAALPFASGSCDAARIERVLQHVGAPRRVLDEVHRVLRPGARLVIFEPDWGSLTFDDPESAVGDAVTTATMAGIRHPRIGLELPRLLVEGGFRIEEIRADPKAYSTLSSMQTLLSLDLMLERAGVAPAEAQAWLETMRARSERGTFWATMNRTIAAAVRV